MQFVRREAGRYYLHQVDRDYALSRLPPQQPADGSGSPPPFTAQALRRRGADYFEQTRTPRAEWKTLDDLAPTLNEYELRCLSEDYDAAARALLAIGYYLTLWGHYRLTAGMLERLQGCVHDPWTNAASMNMLGSCYRALGQFSRAIGCHQQALDAVRGLGNHRTEGASLFSLGNCYWPLGHISKAADLHQQVLALARKTGDRALEYAALAGLGLCHEYSGQLTEAIECHQQALQLAHDVGDRNAEAAIVANLGLYHRYLGQLTKAVRLYQQALAIDHEQGTRYLEAGCLSGLADAYADVGAWQPAAEHAREAVEVADAIGHAQAQSTAWLSMARTMLLSGDLGEALSAAQAASERPSFPLSASRISLLLGVCRLRMDRAAAAARDFHVTITRADELIGRAHVLYEQHDTRALALCGLALITDPGLTGQAVDSFRAARAITSAAGIVAQVLGLFDVLAAADDGGVLAAVRPAAAGEE
jgi:tetratricopeptide (TPR) repeat protein